MKSLVILLVCFCLSGCATRMEDVKKMPISERIQLVEDIWDTIATVPSESQGTLKLSKTELAELDRRLEFWGQYTYLLRL